jgi:DNA-binding IclR family transcriptional regulator
VFVIEFKYEKIEKKRPKGQKGLKANDSLQRKKEVKKTPASMQNLALKAAKRAMAQIKKRGYAERYQLERRAVKLVGVGIAGRTNVAVLME